MTAAPRLFLAADLAAGTRIALDRAQAHYLLSVMRRGEGDAVRVFNGRDGEWRAALHPSGRRDASIELIEQIRTQSFGPDLELLFAPVKKARTDFIVEKAVELGAARIRPVMTERTASERVRPDRLNALAREAAEQTERLDAPVVEAAVRLADALDAWDPQRRLIYCDEAGDEDDAPWGGASGRAQPILQALSRFAPHPAPALPSRGGGAVSASHPRTQGDDPTPDGFQLSEDGRFMERRPSQRSSSPSGEGRDGGLAAGPWAILIGPEGGFSADERARLRGLDFVVPVTLGPRILRADTAAAAALSVWQAALGDWDR